MLVRFYLMSCKTLFFVLFLSAYPSITNAQNGNYILIVNGDSIATDLNKELHIKHKGKELTINLIQPDILIYEDETVSFQYPKDLKVSNAPVEEGVEQCMLVRSTGNGFLIQKYSQLNPSLLNRFMLKELTKESVSYGYSIEEEEVEVQLISGQKMVGTKATLAYQGFKEHYTVYSYGNKDTGVLVVTMLLDETIEEDKEMIDLFLKTLIYKLD